MFNWLHRWVHRRCLDRETALVRERDALEAERSQLRKAHQSLLVAFQRGQVREEGLVRERDRVEAENLRLKKNADELLRAYQSLVESTTAQLRPPDLWQHLFEEVPVAKEQHVYLTPEVEPEPEP